MSKSINTVQEYIAAQPERTQEKLEQLRSCLKRVVPHAIEELKWGKPAFLENGILFLYAAHKNHLSLHPTPHVIQALRHELSAYKLSENTVRLPLDCPIPEAMVLKIAELRVIQKETGMGWK